GGDGHTRLPGRRFERNPNQHESLLGALLRVAIESANGRRNCCAGDRQTEIRQSLHKPQPLPVALHRPNQGWATISPMTERWKPSVAVAPIIELDGRFL